MYWCNMRGISRKAGNEKVSDSEVCSHFGLLYFYELIRSNKIYEL